MFTADYLSHVTFIWPRRHVRKRQREDTTGPKAVAIVLLAFDNILCAHDANNCNGLVFLDLQLSGVFKHTPQHPAYIVL